EIWLGTGEVNSSRSSYAGVGMYYSRDKGKTWEHRGLAESHHIGRVILHPSDPKTLWVAVLGHLYSPNQERGVYKTTDGGQTWERTLFANQNAGAIDLVIDSENPDILYAATWERERRAWNFMEGGDGSDIHKSTDGGKTWTNLTAGGKSGFPDGDLVGRIGLDITKANGKTVLYAVLDNYNRRPKEDKKDEDEGLTKEDLRNMTKEAFYELAETEVKKYLKDNRFPKKYTVKKVTKMMRKGDITPLALVEYLENANSLLFDTPVIGAEVYRSDDEGKTWQKTHEGYLDGVYYSYGYYFGQIRVNPQDANQVYIMGVPVIKSEDGGATWKGVNAPHVHSDHHALWLSPQRPGHLILGNDGGINISYDAGATYSKCNTPAVGQFYDIGVDMAEPYNVYGGLQDNGTWMGPSDYEASYRWYASGDYPWDRLGGGDGMQVAIDTRDNATVYTGYQFGNYFRGNSKTGKRKYITPKHELGERPLRWNWQTPIHLSVHNQDIFYMGSNKVHRSFDQGDNFSDISSDLTKGGMKGDVAFGTLSTLHESPLKFGLIYVGSDDGLIHVTKDGGATWTKISDQLPNDYWVSRVLASEHDEATVYATLNGYRWDNFTPMAYKSTNYGQTWTKISNNLPLEPVNVIEEDPVNPDVLYLGTDHAVYVSLDAGKTWQKFGASLPAVAVHDLEIQTATNDLVVGTHGRSVYVGNVSELQQLNEENLQKELVVFDLEEVKYSRNWGREFSPWREANTPDIHLPIYVKAAGAATMEVRMKDSEEVLFSKKIDLKKGLNYVEYDLSMDAQKMKAYEKMLQAEDEEAKVKAADNEVVYLRKGAYEVGVMKGNNTEKADLVIE
ncbi:MAG: glycosyl hydrolase, partial [Saprospiraceae bacterium]